MHPRLTRRTLPLVALATAALLVISCDGDRATAPRIPTSPALASTASMMFFDANAPGDYGGVSVGISPFASGGPFGGFQSAGGTGVMSDILITFSAPVGSVTITALDPTWAGNQMITSGPGGVIDSYGFAYTNEPGNNVPDAHTVTGEITSVLLVAAPAEYIAYTMQIGVVSQPAFTVSCDTPVERGQTVTCAAAPTNPTAKLEVIGWKFVSSDPKVSFEKERGADEGATSTTWSGIMVVSGTVTVRARVNGGAEDTLPASITVTPRNWQNRPVPDYSVKYIGQGALPEEPRADSSLGEINHYGDLGLGKALLSGAVSTVPLDGPNGALAYVKAVPALVDSVTVAANEAALQKQSSFWYGQREEKPNVIDNSTLCTRSVVTDPQTLEKIKAHEGTTFQTNSHSFFFRKALNEKVGPALEGMVASDPDFPARWNTAVDTLWQAARAASAKTDTIAKLNVGCNFNYTYPSKKKPK